ncbi:MAG: amidophosphoribosyltransferase [Bacteroidales bacterium]|nr:class II glutamine amidotransferase [Bacteroidales bacterium]MDD4001711.1 class II glutamine amidotransferase [Bacteroidales bacterium]MDD4528406.1 class II glutamine amidotransferase [Bacteroidales bacterium]
MSDSIKHECGIALLRLKKPLEYYEKKYGTKYWGLNKMYLLMEKQHNRGQDGAGLASIKFNTEPGTPYVHIEKSNSSKPIQDVITKAFSDDKFLGELYLGHLRYGTFGKNEMENLHPFLRESNWKTRSVVLAGNFNLTNIDEMMDKLVVLGQHPVKAADTAIVLEKIGHFVDREVETLFRKYKDAGLDNITITNKIAEEIDIAKILQKASKRWDGGYVLAGMLGHGDAFVLRDPSGIRPCFYYENDEFVAVASERPVILTALNMQSDQVKELDAGQAIIIKKNGQVTIEQVLTPDEKLSKCSFERIYFSRGTDSSIYQERKKLGRNLRDSILKAINYDIKNTIISYIPNTASVAFQGLAQSFNEYIDQKRIEKILETQEKGRITKEELLEIFADSPRREALVVKDVKMRTFITNDNDRDDLVAHVYDVTYGQVRDHIDNLVVLDDSIVRGTTLKQSIIRILDKLNPKKIVVASSAPQIRYPDCYGIDMSRMTEFIAFNATIDLLKERGMQNVIDEVYQKCKAQETLPKEEVVNYVREIYKPFTNDEITARITKLLTPEDCRAEVEIVYQTIEGLHQACPNHTGDWYFTGKYPTPGGNKVVNQAFINYYEGNSKRAY